MRWRHNYGIKRQKYDILSHNYDSLNYEIKSHTFEFKSQNYDKVDIMRYNYQIKHWNNYEIKHFNNDILNHNFEISQNYNKLKSWHIIIIMIKSTLSNKKMR